MHVVPHGEDPAEYMKPFYTAHEIFTQSRARTEKLVKEDTSLNVRTRDRALNEYRLKQSDYLLNSDSLPLELLMQFEKDAINIENGMTLKQFTDKANNLSKTDPVFASDQIECDYIPSYRDIKCHIHATTAHQCEGVWESWDWIIDMMRT